LLTLFLDSSAVRSMVLLSWSRPRSKAVAKWSRLCL
jgi:hypothetical protein